MSHGLSGVHRISAILAGILIVSSAKPLLPVSQFLIQGDRRSGWKLSPQGKNRSTPALYPSSISLLSSFSPIPLLRSASALRYWRYRRSQKTGYIRSSRRLLRPGSQSGNDNSPGRARPGRYALTRGGETFLLDLKYRGKIPQAHGADS